MRPSSDDLLERVRSELMRRRGELRDIAVAADMHYDTVRRIKSGANDPGYSKVLRLARHLGLTAETLSAAATPANGSEASHAG